MLRGYLCLLLLALQPLAVLAQDEGGSGPMKVEVSTIASGFDFPWGLAFLPDGGYLVTERSGGVKRVDADGTVRAIRGVPAAYVRSQAGMFDVLLARDFERSGRLFLSYAHGSDEANALRIASARLAGDSLEDVEIIFEASPLKDTPVHYGGRLALLPDGTLLATTGDGFDYRERAYETDTHLGKTIRIATDGTVPADNPFVGRDDALPELWTTGHRNPQGLVVDERTGRVWLHEHGPRGGDELNLLQAGANYGWPVASYGVDYNGAYVTPFQAWPGTEPPLVHWTPSIAPAGLALYDGTLFSGWQGDLLVASLAERSIRRIDLEDGQVVGQGFPFPELSRRFRDVRVGPDGAVYLLTDSEAGELLRVAPAR